MIIEKKRELCLLCKKQDEDKKKYNQDSKNFDNEPSIGCN